MSEPMEGISNLLIVVATNVILVGGAYVGARKLGLTDLQKQVKEQTDRLVDRLKDRITELEGENTRLEGRVKELERRNAELEARVDELQEVIADFMRERRR